MVTLSSSKKLFSSGLSKRTIGLVVLLVGLPVVVAGAMTTQNIEQEASIGTEKPNIILLTVDSQRAEHLDSFPILSGRFRKQAMTFTNAIASDTWYDEKSLAGQFQKKGYTDAEITGPVSDPQIAKRATEFITQTRKPYLLRLSLETRSVSATEGNCGIADLQVNPAVNEEDVTDKPRAIRALPRLTEQSLRKLQTEKSQAQCSQKRVDQLLGMLLDSVGDEADTVIIYTARRGAAFGEHRLSGSDCLYTVCRQVPLILYYPRMVKVPLTSDVLVSTDDIPATLTQLTGITTPGEESVSIIPLLTRPDVAVRKQLALDAGEEVQAVRTEEFLYILHATSEEEFYDLEADPWELTNQFRNKDYSRQLNELRSQIANP